MATASINFDFAQQAEVRKHLACAENHRGQGIVSHRNWQPSLFADAFVKVLDQRAAAGQHYTSIADIGGKLWRCALERHANGVHDHRNAFAESFANFAVIDGDGFGYAL